MIRKDGGTHKMNSLAVDYWHLTAAGKRDTRKLHEVSVLWDTILTLTSIRHVVWLHPIMLSDSMMTLVIFSTLSGCMRIFCGLAVDLWSNKILKVILSGQQINAIELALEIGSEAPSVNPNWPSDITFMLNGIRLGEWTSPGDSGNGRGMFTPEWWSDSVNQYGMLKVLRITNEGTFIDGQHLSDITLADIPVERNQWTLRLSGGGRCSACRRAYLIWRGIRQLQSGYPVPAVLSRLSSSK